MDFEKTSQQITKILKGIECLLMTQSRKLLISSSKMRNYIGKKCEQSLKLKLSGLYSSLFGTRFLLIFQKKFWLWGGGLVTEKSRAPERGAGTFKSGHVLQARKRGS